VGWKDLLQDDNEKVTLPWTGGRFLNSDHRVWKIAGPLPKEFGWYRWRIEGRKVFEEGAVDPESVLLEHRVSGYLVGDHIVPDDTRVDPNPETITSFAEKVYLIEPGLDRFVRVSAGRVYPEGPLIYVQQEFPLGSEDAVLEVYLDRAPSVTHIAGVPPALDAAFRMEAYQRTLAEERRRELERLRKEEEERIACEERRRALQERLGDGAGRRAMAKENFAEAASAALQVGGAELLDHRRSAQGGEWIVKYRIDGQRLECVATTELAIVDAGFCLQDHETGLKGDKLFTLESLPSVARQAIREGNLVIWRHI
jgi:hypothetical protein